MPEDQSNTTDTVEFLVGFWLGVAAIALSVTGRLPGLVFIPDGALSIAAGFAIGFHHRRIAIVLGGLAILLLIVGLILLVRQQSV